MTDIPTVDQCRQAFHKALYAGDPDGVEAALIVMAEQDPDQARHLSACLHMAVRIAQTTGSDDPRPVGLRVVGLISGRPSPFDGQWLVEYDPSRAGLDPTGHPMTAHVVCSTDPALARRFATTREAHTYWRAASGRVRSDGQPDRPLTAFSVITEPLEPR
jgi:hypothetical protein